MSAKYETPLLVDVKIEELNISGEKILNLYASYNTNLKRTITKFPLQLPLGLKSNSVTQRQF